MSLINQGGVVNISNYNDNSKQYNIDARNRDLNAILRDIDTENVEPEESKSYTPPFPRKGDYNGVREYVEERKKYDEVFRQYCNVHSRKDVCERLSDEFGWIVDDKSYGKNINRNS